MYWYTVNYGLGILFPFVVGLFVLYRGESRQLVRRTWFSLCVFVTLWHAGKFWIVLSDSELIAAQAATLIYVAAILIPPAYLHFILALLTQEKRRSVFLIGCYGFAGVELLLLTSGHLIDGVRNYEGLGFYEVPGRMFWLYFFSYTLVPGFAVLQLIREIGRTDSAVKSNQLRYVIYSSLIGFLSGITSFFPFVSVAIPPLGAPLVYFYTLPIAYAVARYRLLDIDVVIKKSVIYAILLLCLLLPCYVVVILGQKIAFGVVSYDFSVGTLALLIVVGFYFPKLRFRTEEALERVLFNKRIDSRNVLLRSSRDMVSIVEINALSDKLVCAIKESLDIRAVSLLLAEENAGDYYLRASVGLKVEQSERVVLPREGPLIQLLQRRQEPIVREELEWVPVGPGTPQTIATMANSGQR